MMKHAVFVDASYFIFHRFFATYRWWTLRNPDACTCDTKITHDSEFVMAFTRHFEKDVHTLRKKYGDHADIWFMRDCHRKDIWRMDVYPEYKATRKHADSFDGNIFPIAYELIERLDVRVFCYDRLEADDIVFICQQYCVSHGIYDRITVIANDNDYLQIVSDQISVINKEGKDISVRGSGDPSKDVLKKVLVGDKSDNIPPICSGLGPKTADKLIDMTEQERDAWIRGKGEEAWKRYVRNKCLIEFHNIPIELQASAQENLKNYLSITGICNL